jgi:hypothetical protein
VLALPPHASARRLRKVAECGQDRTCRRMVHRLVEHDDCVCVCGSRSTALAIAFSMARQLSTRGGSRDCAHTGFTPCARHVRRIVRLFDLLGRSSQVSTVYPWLLNSRNRETRAKPLLQVQLLPLDAPSELIE